MEENKEAVQDAQGGRGATAASDEQQDQHVDKKDFHELKDVEVDNIVIEHKNGEFSVESPSPNPEHLSSQVAQVEKRIPPSVDANAKKLCSESVAFARPSSEVQAEDENCEQELNDEVPEVLSSVENGSREEESGNDCRLSGDVQKEEETEGKVKEMEVVAKSKKEGLNGIITETQVQRANEMEELKNEPDIKTPSKSFLLDANNVTGDESGTEEEQTAFMKELETFHRERCLDFKPPKFYQEPLNCLK